MKELTARLRLMAVTLLAVTDLGCLSADPGRTSGHLAPAPGSELLSGRFEWTTSPSLVAPAQPTDDTLYSIKDPSIVFHPDGDAFDVRWYTYPEAGTYTDDITILGGRQARASVVIPEDTADNTIASGD
jgi:hypothetical protein